MTHDEDILLLRTLSALWRIVLWVDDVQCDQILYYRYLNSACVWAYACVFAGQETMTVDECPPRNQGYTTTITELDWTGHWTNTQTQTMMYLDGHNMKGGGFCVG